MKQIQLLAAQGNSGDLPLPVMTIIALLLLMLPYLIRRYTGKSVTEWLRFSVLFEWIDSRMDIIREKLFGKKVSSGPSAKNAKNGNGQEKKGKADLKPAGGKEKSIPAARKRGNAQNDYLHFISEILSFARKNKLFTIIPGNFRDGDRTAQLTAVLVTKSRVVGIIAHAFDGEILCRNDDRVWQSTADGKTVPVGSLLKEAKEENTLLRSVLSRSGMDPSMAETVMVFTGSQTVLKGDQPENAFTRETFFHGFITDRDLREGPLNPKETGMKLNRFRK